MYVCQFNVERYLSTGANANAFTLFRGVLLLK